MLQAALPGLTAFRGQREYRRRDLFPPVAWMCMQTLIVQRQPTFGQRVLSDAEMRSRRAATLSDIDLLIISREGPSMAPRFDESEEVPLV